MEGERTAAVGAAFDSIKRGLQEALAHAEGYGQARSSNVFADLSLPDAEKLRIKTGLVVEIRKAMRALGLTRQAAAQRMGVPQPKVSGMMRGDFTNLSERKLMDCLNRLGYDIEIKARPASEPVGRVVIVHGPTERQAANPPHHPRTAAPPPRSERR